MKRSSKFRTAGWLAVAGLLGAALVAPTSTFAAVGPEVTPTTVLSENITSCPAGFGDTIEVSPSDLSGSAGSVTVTITYDTDAKTVDFVATGGVVLHAYIKGGNDYNWYNYSGLGGVSQDDGLVAPDNASGGPAGLSHAIFCVDETTTTTTTTDTTTTDTTTTDTTTTTTDTTTTTESTASETTDTTTTTTESTASETTDETTTTTTTASSTGSVEGETGRPRHTPPSTDAVSSDPANPSMDSWRLVLVAMAGLIALMLLLTPATAPRKR